MWLQALQSNFQQAPSSIDCQEPLNHLPGISSRELLSFRYIKVAGQATVVSSHTRTLQYQRISSTILVSFQVSQCLLPSFLVFAYCKLMVFHYFRHCSKRTRWHASSHFARHCTRGSSLLWGRRCPLPLMWSWDHPHWLIFQGRSTGNHDISTWNKNPLNTKSVVGSSGSPTAAVCFRMCMGHNRSKTTTCHESIQTIFL